MRTFIAALSALAILMGGPGQGRASIVTTGDVRPTNPASWASYTDGYVGLAMPAH